MANRTVSVALVADVGSYVSGMARASASTKAFGSQTEQIGQQTSKGFDLAGKSAVLLGGAALAVGVGLKSAIGAASDLNETLNKSNVIFGKNAGEIEKWASNSARDFGLSKQAALEAASGFGNMLQQLGFTGDEAVSASTGVVKLAADLGSFNNLETGDVLDRIGAAMRGEYDSLQLLVPNINAARVESEAMAATGKENAKQLTAQEKAAAVLAIVNRDGAAAANDFAETSDGLANSTKITAAQFQDLKARIGQDFLPAAQAAMHFLSETGLPVLEGVYGSVKGLASGFSELPGPVQAAVVAAAGWAVAGDRIMSGFSGIGGALSPMRDGFHAFGEALDYARANGDGLGTVLHSVTSYAGGQALTGLQALGRAIGPELAVAAGAFVVTGFIDGIQSLTQASDEAKAAAEGLAKSLTLTDAAADRRSIRTAIEDTDGLAEVLEKAGVSSKTAINGLLGQESAQRRVLDALKAYKAEVYTPNGAGGNADSQNAREAVLAYEELSTGYGTAASNARYFADEAAGAKEGTEDTGEAAGAATPMVDSFATQMQDAADAADAAKKETDAFKLSLDVLTGAHVSMIEVQSALQMALDAGTDAMDKLGGKVLEDSGALNLHSENGRKASDVLLDVRNSGNELIAQMIEQKATTEEVQAADAKLREDFINTAMQMGINRQAAEGLANQILGIPSERNTQITADTAEARRAIEELQTRIDGLRGRVVDITARAIMPDLNGSASGSGRMGTYADGGWTGPGAKYQPAGIVHADEFVVPKQRVNALGGPRAVGALVGMPGYAEGGPVAPVSIRAELNAASYDSQMNALAGQVLKKYEPVQGFISALQFARSQVGRPYVWGAAGPGGYDCSGFMSAITNVIRGRSPYSRVGSTASFPWAGFLPGNNGVFNIGSTPNAGDGIGHMAGDILGVAVESTGGVGVKVGGSARSSKSSLFSTHGHLAMASGGLIGEPVIGSGLWSGKSYSFGERGDEIVLPRSREFGGGGSGGGFASPVVVDVTGATVSGRVEFGADGIARIVDGRIEQLVTGVGTGVVNSGAGA